MENLKNKSLNYYSELSLHENEIFKKTIRKNRKKIDIFTANLNSLFGMISNQEGSRPDIFPMDTPEKAVRFFVYIQSMASFKFASTIFKQLTIGQYSEAETLIRTFIELVAYGEYYSLNPEHSFNTIKNVKLIPNRNTVFRFLKKHGSYPPGGPKESFFKYNNAAHGHIANILEHTTKSIGEKQFASYIWLRRYNQDSFDRLSHDILIPLFGIQEVYRRIFFPNKQMIENENWYPYWKAGHNLSVLSELFPTMRFGKQEN